MQTSNLRNFPAGTCESLDVEVVRPDAFLSNLHKRAPRNFVHALTEQAAALSTAEHSE